MLIFVKNNSGVGIVVDNIPKGFTEIKGEEFFSTIKGEQSEEVVSKLSDMVVYYRGGDNA